MLPERFWSKVDRTDGCWLWTGARDKDGYGFFKLRLDRGSYRQARATRLAMEDALGRRLERVEHVLHHCDNPPCVRPSHLFVGSHRENVDDMLAKGRQRIGERANCAKLTEAQVRSIRSTTGVRQMDLARLHGVSQALISAVLRREIWRHVP